MKRILTMLILILALSTVMRHSAFSQAPQPTQECENPQGCQNPTGNTGGNSGNTGGNSGNTGPVDVPKYLSSLYYWFLGVVGIAALFAIVFGGVLYMFSGTSLTKTEQARSWIANGIYGIIIAAFSFILLYVINPDLVNHGFDIQKIVDDALKKAPK